MTVAWLPQILRWARANDWRPLYPSNRRLGSYSWTNQVREPGNRRQSTLRVIADISGRVEVHQHMTDRGWVGIGSFQVGASRAIAEILAAMSVIPEYLSPRFGRLSKEEFAAGRTDAIRETRAALRRHLSVSKDPCQDRGVDHPCDVADALDALGTPDRVRRLWGDVPSTLEQALDLYAETIRVQRSDGFSDSPFAAGVRAEVLRLAANGSITATG